jgi:hypothetical protein
MKSFIYATIAVSVAASNMKTQLDYMTKSVENLAQKIEFEAAEAVDYIEDGLASVILG